MGDASVSVKITLAIAVDCLGEEPQLIPIEEITLDVPHEAWATQLLRLDGSRVAEILPALKRLHRGLLPEEGRFKGQLEGLLEVPSVLSHVFQAIKSSDSINSTES